MVQMPLLVKYAWVNLLYSHYDKVNTPSSPYDLSEVSMSGLVVLERLGHYA
jgi:hypothetical protein